MAKKSTAEQLGSAAERLADMIGHRDHLICQRRGEGATLRQIASEASLSHAAVAKILKKNL